MPSSEPGIMLPCHHRQLKVEVWKYTGDGFVCIQNGEAIWLKPLLNTYFEYLILQLKSWLETHLLFMVPWYRVS